MGYHPHYTRLIPVPVTEIILATPRSPKLGGDGWAAAELAATANGTTTTFVADATTGVNWSDFETGGIGVSNRFRGSQLIINSKPVYITDHTVAAGVATFTFTPALTTAETATGKIARLMADIPLFVSQVLIKTAGVTLRVNLRKSGLIANNSYMTLQNGESLMAVDTEVGTHGFPIFVLAPVAGNMEVTVQVP